jgi:hypothetical protein
MGLGAALFFSHGHLESGLHRRWLEMVAEINGAPEEHVLRVDEQAWAAALYERYSVEAPVLKTADKWMAEPEVIQVDVSGDVSRIIRMRPAYVAGHRVKVHIPFTGDGGVFDYLPSSHILVELFATVGEQELIKEIIYPDDNPADITVETEQFMGRVETNLGSARAEIFKFNSSLELRALNTIRERRQAIERHQAHIATTGLRIGAPRDRERTSVEEVIVRRPAPVLPHSSAGQPPIELEPVLLDETYEHILGLIREHARAMSRNPSVYQDMAEEQRRHVILDALNPHFRGVGTAEAFNGVGKTDILLAHEARSLFIAECKIWTGLMFVDRRDLTAVIGKAREVLGAHPQFVNWEDSPAETELRATVAWDGDAQRHADLAVLFFHLPPPRADGQTAASTD